MLYVNGESGSMEVFQVGKRRKLTMHRGRNMPETTALEFKDSKADSGSENLTLQSGRVLTLSH